MQTAARKRGRHDRLELQGRRQEEAPHRDARARRSTPAFRRRRVNRTARTRRPALLNSAASDRAVAGERVVVAKLLLDRQLEPIAGLQLGAEVDVAAEDVGQREREVDGFASRVDAPRRATGLARSMVPRTISRRRVFGIGSTVASQSPAGSRLTRRNRSPSISYSNRRSCPVVRPLEAIRLRCRAPSAGRTPPRPARPGPRLRSRSGLVRAATTRASRPTPRAPTRPSCRRPARCRGRRRGPRATDSRVGQADATPVRSAAATRIAKACTRTSRNQRRRPVTVSGSP